ncbi:MAG TPA: PAS domain S-box protein [Vicinamibacterales bacterium]|nr:PAS domain S-box protein [Vicinamibacterales bacterium]
MLKTQTALGDPPAGTDGGEAPGSRKIRLLYAGDMDFARAQFASEAPRLELVAATEASIRDAKSKGAAPPADVAFIDCSSSGVNATRLLQELRSAFPGMPVVVAVDPGRADAARDAVDLKADDFTVKSPGWLGRLPVRLGMVLSRQSHLSQFDTVRSREERLRGILESAPVCLVRLNRDATVLAINTAGRSLIGAGEAGAVLRKSILAFVSADDRDQLRGFVERVCSGQPGSMEFSTAGSSESARIVEASAIQLAPHAGRSETALLVLRDISARRRLERSLEQAEVPGPGLDNSNAIAELESRLSEAESHRLTLKAERDSLNEAVQDGNTAIEALSKKLQQRQLELNNVAAERDRLSEAVETTGQTIQALEARLEDNRGEVEAVSQRLHERECELHNIVAERSGLSQAVETTGQTVAALEAQLEEKRREVEEVSRRLHERERELHNIAAERSSLSQAVETTGQTVAALEARLEEKRREVEEVAQRLH